MIVWSGKMESAGVCVRDRDVVADAVDDWLEELSAVARGAALKASAASMRVAQGAMAQGRR